MTDFAVTLQDVRNVLPHPNADKLDIIQVLGWQVVVGKGQYKVGDTCVYFPVNSILPSQIEALIFAGSKVKLHKSRVKTIKIRGEYSQGLAVHPQTLALNAREWLIGHDLTLTLGVTKHEPKPVNTGLGTTRSRDKGQENPHFHVYEKFPRIQNVTGMFSDSDSVAVTEKVHGTNFRAGWVEYYPRKWWQKLLKLLRLTPKYEFVYGSHHVQYVYRPDATPWLGRNVYREACEQYRLEERLPKGIVVYGEIYGDGIQPGYGYGLTGGEHRMLVFDVKRDGQYLEYVEMLNVCEELGLETTPLLYAGTYNEVVVASHVSGPSKVGPQAYREGIVVRELGVGQGRKIAKWISPEYEIHVNDEEGIVH